MVARASLERSAGPARRLQVASSTAAAKHPRQFWAIDAKRSTANPQIWRRGLQVLVERIVASQGVALYDAVEAGVPTFLVDLIAGATGEPVARVLEVIGVSPTTYRRKDEAGEPLPDAAGHRVMGFLRVMATLRRLLAESGDAEQLAHFDLEGWVAGWMREPLPQLGNKTPAEMLRNPKDSVPSNRCWSGCGVGCRRDGAALARRLRHTELDSGRLERQGRGCPWRPLEPSGRTGDLRSHFGFARGLGDPCSDRSRCRLALESFPGANRCAGRCLGGAGDSAETTGGGLGRHPRGVGVADAGLGLACILSCGAAGGAVGHHLRRGQHPHQPCPRRRCAARRSQGPQVRVRPSSLTAGNFRGHFVASHRDQCPADLFDLEQASRGIASDL